MPPLGPSAAGLLAALGLSLLLTLLASLVNALRHGLPGWAIPGAGLLIAILWYVFLAYGSSLLPSVHPWRLPWPSSNFGRVVTQTVQYLVAIAPVGLLGAALLLLEAWLPPLRPLNRRVRQDWSLLSLLGYSLALLPILLQDEYRGLGPFQAASLVILAGGAWAGLRQKSPGWRVLALLAAVWIALGVLGLGIYWLYPQQAWAAYTSFPRWWEALNPLLQGPALTGLLVAPALLKLWPAQSAETGSAPAAL